MTTRLDRPTGSNRLPDYVRRSRLRNRARSRALETLRQAHLLEFALYFADEEEKLGL